MSNTYNVSSIMLFCYNFIFHIFALLCEQKMIIFFNIIHLTGKSERYAVICSNPVRKDDAYEYI